MKIDIKNATIRIDNPEEGLYSMHFSSPFNCFISLNLKKAAVTYEIDNENKLEWHWREREKLFKKIMFKTAHKTNGDIFTKADIVGHFEMRKEGVIAIITSLKLTCTSQQLESETAFEKEHREQLERLRKSLGNAKRISIEELHQTTGFQLK